MCAPMGETILMLKCVYRIDCCLHILTRTYVHFPNRRMAAASTSWWKKPRCERVQCTYRINLYLCHAMPKRVRITLKMYGAIHSRTHSHRRIHSQSQYQYCSFNSTKSERRNWKEKKTKNTNDDGKQKREKTRERHLLRESRCLSHRVYGRATCVEDGHAVVKIKDEQHDSVFFFFLLIFVCRIQVPRQSPTITQSFSKWKLQRVVSHPDVHSHQIIWRHQRAWEKCCRRVTVSTTDRSIKMKNLTWHMTRKVDKVEYQRCLMLGCICVQQWVQTPYRFGRRKCVFFSFRKFHRPKWIDARVMPKT